MKSHRVRALATAIAATVPLAVASGCGGDDEPAPVTTTSPPGTFAPLFVLHSREKTFPTSADRVLHQSTLEWTGGTCPFEVNVAAGRVAQRVTREGAPRLDWARLGGLGRPYVARPSSRGCEEDPNAQPYYVTDHTRPFDGKGRAAGLKPEDGFYLDILSEAQTGQRYVGRQDGQATFRSVPTFYDQVREQVDGEPGLRISYWVLFGASQDVNRQGEVVASHEGDWERLDVMLARDGESRYVPKELRIHSSDGVRSIPWSDLELAPGRGGRNHPTIYVALGSHALYTREGAHRRRGRSGYDDSPVTAVDRAADCGACPHWKTWEFLRYVVDQPWYGYGGGWGVQGNADSSSGPAGPMPSSTSGS